MELSRRLLVLLILFCCSAIHAQKNNLLTWTTDSESLPQNSIKAIAPGKYGYLWMSTENGLVRYNGKKFYVYDNNNIGIKNNRFIQILGNYKSDSLYTTNEFQDDYILINKRTARKINLPKNSKNISFKTRSDGSFVSSGSPCILFDVPKRPYIIPLASKSYYFIKNNQIRFYNAKDELKYTRDFTYESNSNFFTFGDHLFYLKNNSEYAIIGNGKIHWNKLDLKMDQNSRLYWNIISQQLFIYSDSKIYNISCENNILMSSMLMECEDLIGYNVCCMYYDTKSNTVYLGSIKKGLGIYKIPPFKAISPNKSENPELYEVFYALYPFTDNTAISASGIIMDNNGIVKNLHLISDKFSLVKDGNDDIWVKKGHVLYHYRKSNNYKNPSFWTFADEISTLFLGKDGNIWFDQTHDQHDKGSIWHFKPTKNPVFYKDTDIKFKVNFFAQTKTGTLWIGSNKGLHQFNSTDKKILSYSATENLKIRNVYMTDEKNIWLTTYEKGFHLFRNKQLCTFPMDRNHFLQSSHSIVEDKKGYFWIPTNKGLFQIRKQRLIDYADKKLKTIYYHYYDKQYGFLSNEFNGGSQPNGITLKNGNVFLPSINGVVNFNPENILPVLPNSDIYIDEAMVDEKKITVSDTLNLDRNFERIKFYIDSPYFGNQKNLNFEVKLDGPDPQEWINVPKDHEISFTKLSPGTYTLIVRKLNGFDGDYSYKKITIFIKPAFWQTNSFSTLLLFFSFLLIFLLYSLRVNYMANKNKQLQKAIDEKTKELKMTISSLLDTKAKLKGHIDNNTRIIQYITHDIKSPLKFMAMTTRHMYNSYDDNTDDLKESLKSIFTSSTQMYNFVDNLLEYSKLYLDKGKTDIVPANLYEITNAKLELFKGIANHHKTEIVNEIPKNHSIRISRQPLSIAIHNLLDNAVKNTYSGMITFRSYITEKGIHIEISDTGKGMNDETLEYYRSMIRDYDPKVLVNSLRLGLQIVIELMLTWGGAITIESIADKGTTITLIFKKSVIILESE